MSASIEGRRFDSCRHFLVHSILVQWSNSLLHAGGPLCKMYQQNFDCHGECNQTVVMIAGLSILRQSTVVGAGSVTIL
jgi:hypothetical protein